VHINNIVCAKSKNRQATNAKPACSQVLPRTRTCDTWPFLFTPKFYFW